jgi:hypothetical protein
LGTLNVASRLNCRQHHPKIVVEDPDDGTRAPVAFPYQGDFLLFLRQGQKIKLINWTVKKHEDDFRVPEPASAARKERVWQKLQRRLLIERQYYADIGVLTVEVGQNILDPTLIANLRTAFSYKDRKINIDHQRRSAVLETFRSAAQDGVSATDVLTYLEQDRICDIETGKNILFRSIWDRSLRLDLFSNVVLNAPLKPEVEDVFQRYAPLFPGAYPQGQPSPRAA